MPTRFPTGLNMLPGDSALRELPFPVLNSQWAVFFDDFEKPGGLVASSTGGNFWNLVSYTAAGSANSGASGNTAALNTFGQLNLTTAANANGGIYAYIGNGTAEGVIANAVLGTATGATPRDFIISARLSQGTVTTSGFAFGALTTGELNDGAGAVLDIATAATALTNACVIRKGSGATDVLMDCYSGGSKIITSQTVAANASLVVATQNRYTIHYRAGANKLDAYFNDKRVASVTPSAAIPTTALGLFVGARADGSNATARNVAVDYILAAVKVGAR